jgi:hypothetical protein
MLLLHLSTLTKARSSEQRVAADVPQQHFVWTGSRDDVLLRSSVLRNECSVMPSKAPEPPRRMAGSWSSRWYYGGRMSGETRTASATAGQFWSSCRLLLVGRLRTALFSCSRSSPMFMLSLACLTVRFTILADAGSETVSVIAPWSHHDRRVSAGQTIGLLPLTGMSWPVGPFIEARVDRASSVRWHRGYLRRQFPTDEEPASGLVRNGR